MPTVRVGHLRSAGMTDIGKLIEEAPREGGYATLEAPSMNAAVELTKRSFRIHGDEWNLECELRPVPGPEFSVRA